MVDYNLIIGFVVPAVSVWAADRIARFVTKRKPSNHRYITMLIKFVSTFIFVAYGIADTAMVLHEAGAPIIAFVGALGIFSYIYLRDFRRRFKSIKTRSWRVMYAFAFAMGCFVLAPITYFLLAFSILELQYNIIPNL